MRENLAKVMDEVCDSASHIVVTRRNARPVVMISYEEFRGMEETLHLLSSPANAERLMQSIAELDAGHFVEHDIVDPIEAEDKSAA